MKRSLATHVAAASLAGAFALGINTASAQQSKSGPLLHPADYQHYVQLFQQQEQEATGKIYNGEPTSPDGKVESAWAWMQREIPWFDSSDKQFEEMYYFRWYAWKKHLVHTPDGYLITEWLPRPQMKNYDVLNDAAPFHLGEARWLHSKAIAEDASRFWYTPDAGIFNYSSPVTTAVYDVTLANGDTQLADELLPKMIDVYKEWQKTHQDSNGLYWSIDTRDAMEKSISGDGYRPTLNSYQVSDARAIANIAQAEGKTDIVHEYEATANTLNHLIETKLWNPKDQFYEVMSPAKDSGIRSEKKFKDNGTTLQLSGVREQIGYDPWGFAEPAPAHAVAWLQLFNPEGFDGKYGATTAERRSPRFRFASSDQCTWNGPAWPFAMTQTLNALARYEDSPGHHTMTPADYYKLFGRYVLAQHLKLANGKTVDWIDEDYDADTDQWIAKTMLIAKNKQVGRGNYYNHSGFADPLITGLIGLRPQTGNEIVLKPLLPAGTWTYFAIDQLPYHGHMLTIAYDATGQHYHHGKGFWIEADGKLLAHRATLGPLTAELPRQNR